MSEVYGLLIDTEWCTGCQSCELACKNEHGYPLDIWGIKVLELGPFEREDGNLEWQYVPKPTSYCDLCENKVKAREVPSCQLHCLAGVIEHGRVEDLARKVIDKNKSKLNIFIP